MSNNKFWLNIWKLVLVAFVSVVVSISSCSVYQSNKIKEMTSSGTTALEASCAIYGMGSSTTCLVLVTNSTRN